jgi:ribosomal protein S17
MENKMTQVNKAPKFQGIVVSDRMDKTIVVAVETLKTHPKYKKQYISTKRFKVSTATTMVLSIRSLTTIP